MEKSDKSTNLEKFMALSDNKRDRIINAAMKEFRHGYKRASTDTIVKEAAISKGLLFHYFGTKENLYEFLVRFTMDTLQKDYFNMIELGQQDVIASIWQQALLMRDISDKYSCIYDFLSAIHIHAKETGASDMCAASLYVKRTADVMEDMYNNCDTNLFRSDIDHKQAIDLILWGINGFFHDAQRRMITENGTSNHSYDIFSNELRSYLDIFQLVFYKEG